MAAVIAHASHTKTSGLSGKWAIDLTVLATAEPPSKAPANSKIATRITVCLGVRVLEPITDAETVLPSWNPLEYAKIEERQMTAMRIYVASFVNFLLPVKTSYLADFDDYVLQLCSHSVNVLCCHYKTSVHFDRAHDSLQIVYGK
jgi:hypothetical protein